MAVAITRTADLGGVTSVGNICTFSGVAIGSAASDRIIVVCTANEENGGASPISATIDYGAGVVATSAVSLGQIGSVTSRIFYVAAPTGTSATIRVSWSGACDAAENSVAVYSVTGANSTPSTSGQNSTTTMYSGGTPLTTGSITIPSNGGFVGVAAGAAANTTKTWTNATVDVLRVATAYCFTTATSTTPGTVTVTCYGGTLGEDGALSYIVFAPSLVNYTTAGDAGAFSVSGTAATLRRASKVIAAAGSYSFSGTAVTLRKTSKLAAAAGAFAFSGSAAALTRQTAGAHVTTALSGAFSFSGENTSLLRIRILPAVGGAYVFSGAAATLKRKTILVADGGVYSVSGKNVTFVYSGVRLGPHRAPLLIRKLGFRPSYWKGT